MPPLDRVRLTISGADVDGDGSLETGVFEMAGDLETVPGMRTGYIVGGKGSTINAIVSQTVGDGENKREGFFFDLGGGARTLEIKFRGWKGARDQDGTPLQWGNDPNVSKTQASATGQSAQTQMAVFMRYLEIAEIDSRRPAVLEYSEYSEQGLYEPIDVAIEGPNLNHAADMGEAYDGNMVLISAASIDDVIDTATGLYES